MASFEIVDGFLPEADFDQVRDTLTGRGFPWYFNQHVATETDPGANPTGAGDFYFTHEFFHEAPTSNFFGLLSPILGRFGAERLIRAKANLYPRTPTVFHHGQHVDMDAEHIAAVFYINTCDGATRFSDGDEVRSAANRLLVFDGRQWHNSTSCTDAKARFNINLNFRK